MRLDLSTDDMIYGAVTVGVFLPVALLGYPLALRHRHSEELRDTIPLRCIAMHFAGWIFVLHDWINWHNSKSVCLLLSVLQPAAASLFYCTLLWKHHAYYIRHVADRADHRFTLLAMFGCVAFVCIGATRFFYDLFGHMCLRLDAAVASVGLVQLLAGIGLFHRVGRLPGACELLHGAIRFELFVALLAVLSGFVKQWWTTDAPTVAFLALMSLAFNVSFILFMAPLSPCCKRGAGAELESVLLESQNGLRSHGSGERPNRSTSSRNSANQHIAAHFQGRLHQFSQKLIKRIREGKSERSVLSELERSLTASNVPAKLIVNVREPGTDRTVLHYAAAVGYDQVVDRLIEYSGNDLEQVADASGLEPLHCAVIGHESVDLSDSTKTIEAATTAVNARVNILGSLMRHGARINSACLDGRRPLHFAVVRAKGELPVSAETPTRLIEALLAAGARQEVATPAPNTDGASSLHFLATEGTERHDLEHHHVVNRGSSLNKTPMMLAVESDDPQVVLCLLRSAAASAPTLMTSTAIAGISGPARRAGLTCQHCAGASLLHVALAVGATRVCQLLLTPHLPNRAFNRPLPADDCRMIHTIIRPMLGSRTDTPHGWNVLHAAALNGDPTQITWLLHAISAPIPVFSPHGGNQRPAFPPSPRTPSPTPTGSPAFAQQSPESASGALLISQNPFGTAAFEENEAMAQRIICSDEWQAFASAAAESFGAVPAPPTCACPFRLQTRGSANALARREAAVKTLKNVGFASADRLARLAEQPRPCSVDELLANVDSVRGDVFKRLKGRETRLDPTRAAAEAAVAATLTLLHHQFAKLQPIGNNNGRSQARVRSGVMKGETMAFGCNARTPTTSTLVSPAGTNSFNLWLTLIKLIDARAYEFGAAFSDNMSPVTPMDIAGSRGHLEYCRIIAALTRITRTFGTVGDSGGAGSGGAAAAGGGSWSPFALPAELCDATVNSPSTQPLLGGTPPTRSGALRLQDASSSTMTRYNSTHVQFSGEHDMAEVPPENLSLFSGSFPLSDNRLLRDIAAEGWVAGVRVLRALGLQRATPAMAAAPTAIGPQLLPPPLMQHRTAQQQQQQTTAVGE
jgi:hypothetical protein